MKLFGKDLSREVAVLAEVGVNHGGNGEAASNLLRLAASAGAKRERHGSYSLGRRHPLGPG